MKLTNLSLKTFWLLLLLPLFSASQEKNVLIRIIQDQSTALTEFDNTLTLQKKQFKIQVLLDHVEGMYVFASIKDSIYRFTETSPIRDFEYLKLLELREGDKFNENKELSISETGWSYWFYKDSADWHSFNRKVIKFGPEKTVCTKVIHDLWDVTEGKSLKIKSLKDPLYLFILVVKEYDEDGKPKTELLRRKLKINWTDEDD